MLIIKSRVFLFKSILKLLPVVFQGFECYMFVWYKFWMNQILILGQRGLTQESSMFINESIKPCEMWPATSFIFVSLR